MEIILTGTGSPIPDPNRAGPSTLVKSDEVTVLVDAGRGAVMRLAAAGVLPTGLAAVCITHLHSDHLSAFNDLITTQWTMGAMLAPGEALTVYGPVGMADHVERTLAMLADDIGYRIAHHDALTEPPQVDVTELTAGVEFTIGHLQVRTAATVHNPVEPTLGYRFTDSTGSAAIVGDTIPCVGVDDLCTGVDAYVQTAVRDDLILAIPAPMAHDLLDYHSSLIDAAQTATRAHVKRLVLTHMVPAPNPDQYDEWRSIAAEHYSGEIVIGDDLTSVVLG